MPVKNLDAYAQVFKRGVNFSSLKALLAYLCRFESNRSLFFCLGNARFMVAARLVSWGSAVEMSVLEAKGDRSLSTSKHSTCSREAVDVIVEWLRGLVPPGAGPMVLKVWHDAQRPLQTEAHGVAYIDTDRDRFVWMDSVQGGMGGPPKTTRRNSQQVNPLEC
jgi:hypothetical protein